MTRRLTVEIVGGTAAEQADALRGVAFTVENRDVVLGIERQDSFGDRVKTKIFIIEMVDYDREKLATAWIRSRFGTHNALARATEIADDRLALILLGERQATTKELNAICEELNIAVTDVQSDAS